MPDCASVVWKPVGRMIPVSAADAVGGVPVEAAGGMATPAGSAASSAMNRATAAATPFTRKETTLPWGTLTGPSRAGTGVAAAAACAPPAASGAVVRKIGARPV